MRILVVHNTDAGDGAFDRDSLLALISTHGHEVEYVTADGDWTPAVHPSVELVVAAGGDGTVADIARRIAGRLPIGVLPLGTANNIATALHLANTPIHEIVAGWADPSPRPFDTGRASGPGEDSRFIESVGVGLLAASIGEITEGSAGYVDELAVASARVTAAVDVLQKTLRDLAPLQVDLEIDGARLSGEYLMVEVMNFGRAGANLRLAPHAIPGDGRFDVVLAEERHREQLIEDLPRYRAGETPARKLPTYQAHTVVLTCRSCRLHLDDRLRDWDGTLTLTVEPHLLTFLA